MSTEHLVPKDISELYEIHEWRNATGILSTACVNEWEEIQAALRSFKLMRSEVLAAGGNRSSIVDRLERPLKVLGWIEKKFATAIVVDGISNESPTHSVDCFKGRVAIEVEWNNKDPFYDRDLNNFRLLFDLQVIDVGIIITRCSSLQDIFARLGKGSSYGNSTTHMGKLLPRLRGGSGGGCPILAFGISESLYIED
jgi:hypothetical protein